MLLWLTLVQGGMTICERWSSRRSDKAASSQRSARVLARVVRTLLGRAEDKTACAALGGGAHALLSLLAQMSLEAARLPEATAASGAREDLKALVLMLPTYLFRATYASTTHTSDS